MASVVATLLLTPLVAGAGGGGLDDHRILLLGAAVGLLSSVIPYSCELVALRTLPPSVFAILMSLEPAAAALAGMLVVGEFLTGVQWVAIVCVVVASIGATRSRPMIARAGPGLSGWLARQFTQKSRAGDARGLDGLRSERTPHLGAVHASAQPPPRPSSTASAPGPRRPSSRPAATPWSRPPRCAQRRAERQEVEDYLASPTAPASRTHR